MTLLNRYFSDEHLARTAEVADEDIVRVWKAYMDTIPEKADIIAKLSPDTCYKYGPRLKEILSLELADVAQEEKDEEVIVADLGSLEHRDRKWRIIRLEECMHNAQTAHEYTHGLLAHLFSILTVEWHLVNKLGPNLIAPLVNQFELEKEVISRIDNIGGKKENFHKFFRALVRGEHIIHRMDKGEKKLVKIMQARMNAIFYGTSDVPNRGMLFTWIDGVCNAIKVRVSRAIDNGELNPDWGADFIYVNRPEFVDMVREAIMSFREENKVGKVQRIVVSDKLVNTFVQVFREWYCFTPEKPAAD